MALYSRNGQNRRHAMTKIHTIPKRLGRRLVPKDEEPIRSKAHLDLVRRQACIISGYNEGSGRPYCVAHHPRELFPRTGGKRICDFLCVSLRPDLHDGYGHSLHKYGNGLVWWEQYQMIPRATIFHWIREFLLENYSPKHPGVLQALSKITLEESRQ